ncbi:MAG: leucine-rich repeat domain-containing protein [Ruminococcaceae bacterium]|nr:leucine-rich repeat domain-containing protein [Oscillospiraceae bacterium]
MKKTISLLLALLMFIAALPLSAYAADLATPTFSKESGAYDGSVKVSISTTNLFADIYYEIYEYGMSNFKGALKQSATKYTSSLTITEPCYITAWTERNNETSEAVTNRYYIRYASDEGRFTVDENGVLTAYAGNTSDLVIPDEVNGIPVNAIGDNCFSQMVKPSEASPNGVNDDYYSNYLRSITLPDTCKTLGDYAFYGCTGLKSVYGKAEVIGQNCFRECWALTNIDFSSTVSIGGEAFIYTSIPEVRSETISTLGSHCFKNTFDLRTISLPNLENYRNYVFAECGPLTNIELGKKVSELKPYMFDYCYNLKEIRAEGVTEISRYALRTQYSSIYQEYRLLSCVYVPKLAGALGGSIRLSDSGLRFGFNWDNSTDYQAAYGEDNTEYGFVYAYERTDDLTVENGKTKVAEKRIDNDGKTSFNLVFTDIPKENYKTEISARAYVCIDGVYFYSDIITRSFEGVANAVLADPDIDQSIKDQLNNLLED